MLFIWFSSQTWLINWTISCLFFVFRLFVCFKIGLSSFNRATPQDQGCHRSLHLHAQLLQPHRHPRVECGRGGRKATEGIEEPHVGGLRGCGGWRYSLLLLSFFPFFPLSFLSSFLSFLFSFFPLFFLSSFLPFLFSSFLSLYYKIIENIFAIG